MSLTLELPNAIELQFQQEAKLKGLNLDDYLVQLLQKAAAKHSKKDVEAELLQKISKGLSEKDWLSYHTLLKQRREDNLSNTAHQELAKLIDKIELANANRMKHLIQLAQLRNTSLRQLMTDLELRPLEV
jgi:hypothetical protein